LDGGKNDGVPALSPRIVKYGEITVTGLSGDGSQTAEAWEAFDAMYKRKTFARSDSSGWEIRFYDGDVPAISGADVHVGFETASVTDGYTSVTLPESEYVVFDVPVASGYESRNSVMDVWLADNANIYAQRMYNGLYYAVERYGERFNVGSSDSSVEIWIPIVKV
jgi:predicted transcriptional regulator YdeE